MRIVHGCDAILWFVKQDVNFLFALDWFVVEANFVGWVYFSSKFGNNYTVDADNAGLNVGVGLTTRADTCICNKAVKSYRFVWIEIGLLRFVYLNVFSVAAECSYIATFCIVPIFSLGSGKAWVWGVISSVGTTERLISTAERSLTT